MRQPFDTCPTCEADWLIAGHKEYCNRFRRYQANVSIDVEQRTVDNIYEVVRDMSGVSAYWADITFLSDRGLRVQDRDDREAVRAVYPQTVFDAMERIVNRKFRVNDQIRGWITEALLTDEPGIIDADCTDVILQACLFEELVYG